MSSYLNLPIIVEVMASWQVPKEAGERMAAMISKD